MTDDPAQTQAQAPWARDEIESPCIKVCVVHPEARICTGCLRSIDEITRWSRLSPAERQDIMAALPGRAGALKKRRGGRAARLARAQDNEGAPDQPPSGGSARR